MKRLFVFVVTLVVSAGLVVGLEGAGANAGGWDIGVCAWAGLNDETSGAYPWYAETRDLVGGAACTVVGVQFPGMSVYWSWTDFAAASKNGSQPSWTRHHVISYMDGIQTYRQLSCGC